MAKKEKPTILLKNPSRGKGFKTTMYTHIYEAQKKAGKMQGWIPAILIKKVEEEEIEDGNGDLEVEVVKDNFMEELNKVDPSNEIEKPENTLSKRDKLKETAKEMGLEFPSNIPNKKLEQLIKDNK
jgi:hypothetical protein